MTPISLTGLFNEAENKGVSLQEGASYDDPDKAKEFYGMVHNVVEEGDDVFCVEASKIGDFKIEVTITSPLLESQNCDWSYVVIDSSCNIVTDEKRIKWNNGFLPKTDQTEDLYGGVYTVRATIHEYTGFQDFSEPIKSGSTKEEITITSIDPNCCIELTNDDCIISADGLNSIDLAVCP